MVANRWTFTKQQNKAVNAALTCPDDRKAEAILHAEDAINEFLNASKVGKPNVAAEIERLASSVEQSLEAFDQLSAEARHCLGATSAQGGRIPRLEGVREFLETLGHAANDAISRAPSPDGAPIKVASRNLIAHLRNAFITAHMGKKSPRGWSLFRTACTDPLVESGTLEALSDEAWRQQLKSNRLTRPFARLEEIPRKPR
jgi:hypothetical protein